MDAFLKQQESNQLRGLVETDLDSTNYPTSPGYQPVKDGINHCESRVIEVCIEAKLVSSHSMYGSKAQWSRYMCSTIHVA